MRHYETTVGKISAFQEELTAQKAQFPDIDWYPYGILNNIQHLRPLITPETDNLFRGGMRFADVGAADGDLCYFFESQGNQCDIYDFGPTNYNSLNGAATLKKHRNSLANINEVNLDDYFIMNSKYDLIFFLGILYHLKNPFYVLEKLSRHSRYMFLSTRIARFFSSDSSDLANVAAAYLLDPQESNNDATNFWVFTDAGLRRILARAGWEVISFMTGGDHKTSCPSIPERDERAFCGLKSVNFS